MHPGYRSHCPVLPPTIDWSAPYCTALELCPYGRVGLAIISVVVQLTQYAPSFALRAGWLVEVCSRFSAQTRVASLPTWLALETADLLDRLGVLAFCTGVDVVVLHLLLKQKMF